MATITVLLIWNVVLGCECRSVNDVMAHHLQRCWPDGGFEMGSTSISRLFSWLLAWTSQINVRKPVKWIVWNGTHQVFHLFWFQSGTAQQTQQIQHWADTAPLGYCPGFCYNEIPNVSCFQRIPPLFFECHESLDICGTYYLPILLVSLFLMASLEIATQSRRTNFAYQRYWEAIGAPTSLLAIQRGNINGFMAENQNPDLNMGQYGIRPLW